MDHSGDKILVSHITIFLLNDYLYHYHYFHLLTVNARSYFFMKLLFIINYSQHRACFVLHLYQTIIQIF